MDLAPLVGLSHLLFQIEVRTDDCFRVLVWLSGGCLIFILLCFPETSGKTVRASLSRILRISILRVIWCPAYPHEDYPWTPCLTPLCFMLSRSCLY